MPATSAPCRRFARPRWSLASGIADEAGGFRSCRVHVEHGIADVHAATSRRRQNVAAYIYCKGEAARALPIWPLTGKFRATGDVELDRVNQAVYEALLAIAPPTAFEAVTVSKDYAARGDEGVIHVDSSAGPVRVTLPRPSTSLRRRCW